VRALVRRREAAEPLRILGAKVAVAPVDDADTLAVVLKGAHTVCHLVGGLMAGDDAYEDEVAGTLRAVLDAAGPAGVGRVLYLSYPGASPEARNAYLRAKGRAEASIADSGLEHAVIRCTHIYGPESEWLRQLTEQSRRTPAVVLGHGTQQLAPIFVDDVAATLAAADDRAGNVSGVWSLQGPDVVTADELADLLAGRARRKLHVGPGAVRLLRRGMPRAALEVLAADSLADDAPDAAGEFGIARTPLAEGLARSLASMED
jgi:NADH dehydrogenase